MSGMYRVCVGKALKDTGSGKGSQGHGKRGNNYLLRAEREKSKLSKLQTDYYLQQPKQHKPTTHCARNNTASAQGYRQTTELHGTARKPEGFSLLAQAQKQSFDQREIRNLNYLN